MEERMRQIEAEMARFENEISTPSSGGQMMPPPQAMLRFMPHQLQPHQGGGLPPRFPMPPMMPPFMRGPPGGRFPPMPPPPMHMGGPPGMPHFNPPRMPVSLQRAQTDSGSTFEAAPTRYTAPGAVAAAASLVTLPGKHPAMTASAGASGSSSSMPAAHAAQIQTDYEAIQNKKRSDLAYQNSYIGQVLSGKKRPKRFVRTAGHTIWEDPSLAEWDPNDYRLFCGDLGNEVSDELLAKTFGKYPSFQRAKVVRDKRTNKTRGYGFVSFRSPDDFIKAMREMNGKYVGNRPIKLRRSDWKERDLSFVKKKTKEKQKLGLKL